MYKKSRLSKYGPSQNKKQFYYNNVQKIKYTRRAKREVLQRNRYNLKMKYSSLTPIGAVGKLLTRITVAAKNHSEIRP